MSLSTSPPASPPPAPTPVTAESARPTTTASSVPPTTRPVHEPVTTAADAASALSEAMAAWGRFAVTGDLGEVSPWFVEEGPQFRQFEQEAPRLAAAPIGEPPYAVVVDDLVVSEMDGSAEAVGRFVFVRTGEESQSFRWKVELRQLDGGWQVWTVMDSGQ